DLNLTHVLEEAGCDSVLQITPGRNRIVHPSTKLTKLAFAKEILIRREKDQELRQHSVVGPPVVHTVHNTILRWRMLLPVPPGPKRREEAAELSKSFLGTFGHSSHTV